MSASPSALTGRVPGGRKFYFQLLAMQDVLYLQSLDANTKAADRAACARAWEVLEERKRIMRGRPLPGSFKPDQPRKAKQAASVTPIARVNDAVDKPAA